MSNAEKLTPCGCCASTKDDLSHRNPPGRDEIAYRMGTHSSFKHRMLRYLPKEQIPDGDYENERPLSKLTTRADEDASIALLDAWATTANMLTFYQERIANEGFLRTATERISVLELARAIGYELNPGVAASTCLAFTIDDSAGTPPKAEIPVGTQVQSLPAKKGELPQTFETSQDFTAYAKWNELRPLTKYNQFELSNQNPLYFIGSNAPVKAGDCLLLITPNSKDVCWVKDVELEKECNRLKVILTAKEEHYPNSPIPTYEDQGVPKILTDRDFNKKNIQTQVLDKSWQESNLQIFLKMNGWDVDNLLDFVNSQIKENNEKVFAFREQAGIFGNTAPRYASLPSQTSGSFKNWDDGWEIWQDNVDESYFSEPDIYLDRIVDDLARDSWVILQEGDKNIIGKLTSATDTSIAGFAMSAKVTGLNLTDQDGKLLDKAKNSFMVRKTTVYIKSEKLELAPLPFTEDLPAGNIKITLDRMVLGLQINQSVSLSGEQADAKGVIHSEILTLAEITHCGGYTTLEFNSGLSYSYRRETVTINANVVPATHGETVATEVLGSGDGTKKHQTFNLKKPPLTYTSTAIPGGAQSTLTVQVDNIKWQQANTLYGLDKNCRSFIIRLDDEANARVIFGDGKQGARLPTGQENVVATYRSGIGSGGEVAAGSLTLMKTRPFGAKSVTNPVKASGADDPEALTEARTNAPLTVLTMERIVSLQDYEDFARAFAGVGKARAAVLWNGEKQVVHVTVADANGDVVTETSTLFENLLEAMKASRNPLEDVSLGSFQPLSFDLEAKVLIDSVHTWEILKEDIKSKLLATFSFEKRAFGQAVTAAEVISTIHRTTGVTAVDLDVLKLTTTSESESTTPASILTAHLAELDSTTGSIMPAELILINEGGITLKEMETI